MKKILKSLAAAAMLGLVFCTGITSHASNGNVVLVLDPGHDVHDAGARRTWNGVTYAEETITLKWHSTVRRAGKILRYRCLYDKVQQ